MSPGNLEIIFKNSDLLKTFSLRSDTAIVLIDKTGKPVNWNKTFNKITGFSDEEIQKIQDYELDFDEKADLLVFPSKYGGYIQFPVSPISSSDVISGGFIGIKFPETPPVLQKCKHLVKQTNLYDAILRSMSEGIYTLDKDLRITFFSPKAEQILGFKSEEIEGKLCSEVLLTENCKRNCPVKQARESKTSITYENTEIKKSNGNILKISKTVVPLSDSNNKTIGVLVLIKENPLATPEIKSSGFMGIIGNSPAIRKVFTVIKQISDSDINVLITGESGTGKEITARAIHKLSKRKNHVFQALNCAALPENLLESELFGHVKGAFTGAIHDRAGYIETAEDGTLFLDEIGELPLNMQVKLLRFLQEREFQRVGESGTRKSNVRIITATNKDLLKEVENGNFREDLYYRIKVVPIHLPPLRERKEDIPLLAEHFLQTIEKQHGKEGMRFAHDTLTVLKEHEWHGNVRELINAVEYAVVLSAGNIIKPSDLPKDIIKPLKSIPVIVPPVISEHKHITYKNGNSEKHRILKALENTNNNKTKAAALLGIDRSTLYRKMKKHGIKV